MLTRQAAAQGYLDPVPAKHLAVALLAKQPFRRHDGFAMKTRIVIELSGATLRAELSDSPAARKVAGALPLTVSLSRWGDEYYGSTVLTIAEDATAREFMTIGEIAFWPPGKALCIFFGPTPASTDGRPRAASAVLPVGRITQGIEALSGMGARVKAVFRPEAAGSA